MQHNHVLVISEEALGRIVTKKINPIETHVIVPVDKLNSDKETVLFTHGRTFTMIKINAKITPEQYSRLNTYLAPSFLATMQMQKDK